MENKQKKNKLNVHVWGGEKELNVEGADAVVCIAVYHEEEHDRHDVHIEGAFKGMDYLRIYRQLENTFGKEHLMIYIASEVMGGLVDKIAGGANEPENETESEPAEGGDGEKPD